MNSAGALITYVIGKSESNVANPLPLCSSGLRFGRRWVLTHGSLISSLRAANKILKNNENGVDFQGDRRYKTLPSVSVSYESNDNVTVRNPADVSESLKNSPIDGREVSNIVVSKGKIRFLWKCELLANIIDNLFTNWTMGHKQGDLQEQDEIGKTFLPVFVLIDIGDPSSAPSVRDALTDLLRLLAPVEPQRGEGVLLQGTPFGHEVFLNSLSRGLACNCLGEGPQLLLCDASTTLGCEGGPAYLEDKNSVNAGRLFGMTLNSLSWNRGEWVGLSLVGCLRPSLRHLLAPPPPSITLPQFFMPKELPVLAITDIIDSTIVLVRCGESWGSGVVLGKGYILTCAHVVQKHGKYDLSVFCKGKTGKAKLIYKTPDNMAYDLAVIHSDDFISSKAMELATKPAVRGETVVAVGFPFFSEAHTDALLATITKGSVTKSLPNMLQTSCCVQSGCSGGAVLRLLGRQGEQGAHRTLTCQLLGIITSNTIDEKNNTKFPNINMAIPTGVFQETLNKFMQNPTPSILNELEEKQLEVQSLWKLKSKL